MIEATKDMKSDCQSKVICPKFEYTFAILGKKWTGLIIDVLLEGPVRFKDLTNAIPHVSDRVLVERLKELEQEGIVTRPVEEERTSRVGYCLSEKGFALKKVMDEVQNWADEWVCVDEEAPVS